MQTNPPGIAIASMHEEYRPEPEPKSTQRSTLSMMAFTAMLGGGFPFLSRRPSSADIRHDPERPKTPEDLERMAAAQRKRDRKAAKRNSLQSPITDTESEDGN